MDTNWDTNHEGYRAIFNAALAGICANPAASMDPRMAVEFAHECVLAAIHGDAHKYPHERPGYRRADAAIEVPF